MAHENLFTTNLADHDAGGQKNNLSQITKLGEILRDANAPMKKRFRALFALKHIGGPDAIECITSTFGDSSALLKHELAYCLGQMRDKRAVPYLKHVLSDPTQEPMVRHEAGEALGAIGASEILQTLESFADDDAPEVAQTCQLAIERIKWLSTMDKCFADWEKNAYSTIDPAPALNQSQSVTELKEILLDSNRTLWERYRAMFSLRNIKTDEAVQALAEGLRCEDSALFRHEIAFVLGQLRSSLTVRQLIERLELSSENCMVRHECAEALGAIGSQACRNVLQQYLNDRERVVRESCEVALDISDYEQSNEFQYAGDNSYSSDRGGSVDDGASYYSSVGF